MRETHDFLSLPLYVAPGTVLPWGSETERPDYAFDRGVTLRVFGLADGATSSFAVASLQGTIAARGTVRRTGGRYQVDITDGALHDWCIDVDGRCSAVQATAASLSWEA